MKLVYNTIKVKNDFGELIALYPHTSDNVVTVRAKGEMLDAVLLEIDNHLLDDLKHIKSGTSDGTSVELHITDNTITTMSEMLFLLKANVDIGDNATFEINELGKFPIVTFDLSPIKQGLIEGIYLLLKYDATGGYWVAINYLNRSYVASYIFNATGSATGFYIPDFNKDFDSIITMAFNQTVLQETIDYSIEEDGRIVFLGGYFMNSGEQMIVTYLKNSKR